MAIFQYFSKEKRAARKAERAGNKAARAAGLMAQAASLRQFEATGEASIETRTAAGGLAVGRAKIKDPTVTQLVERVIALEGGLADAEVDIKGIDAEILAMQEEIEENADKQRNGTLLLSSTFLGFAEAFVKIINAGDVVQSKALLALAGALEGAMTAGLIDDPQSNSMRAFAVILNALAYWDPAVGLQSILMSDSGGLFGPAATTTIPGTITVPAFL